jgi:hypothetical protein
MLVSTSSIQPVDKKIEKHSCSFVVNLQSQPEDATGNNFHSALLGQNKCDHLQFNGNLQYEEFIEGKEVSYLAATQAAQKAAWEAQKAQDTAVKEFANKQWHVQKLEQEVLNKQSSMLVKVVPNITTENASFTRDFLVLGVTNMFGLSSTCHWESSCMVALGSCCKNVRTTQVQNVYGQI